MFCIYKIFIVILYSTKPIIMKNLNQYQFNEYVKSLEIVINTDNVSFQDEYGEVSNYNDLTNKSRFDIAIYDHEEYDLTDEQKDKLHEMMVHENNKHQRELNNAFSDDDRQHAINLIYK